LSVCGIGHSHGGNLPVHLGLGKAGTVDLRVTFPGGKVVELRGVKTDQTVSASVVTQVVARGAGFSTHPGVR
jgi:hypothetical protein